MTRFAVGIDSGSSFCKGVLLSGEWGVGHFAPSGKAAKVPLRYEEWGRPLEADAGDNSDNAGVLGAEPLGEGVAENRRFVARGRLPPFTSPLEIGTWGTGNRVLGISGLEPEIQQQSKAISCNQRLSPENPQVPSPKSQVPTLSIQRFSCLPAGWNIKETGRNVLEALLEGLPPEIAGSIPIVATGYGRGQIEGRTAELTEISAHAAGAELLHPGIRTLIDIGGQDCKVISVENGRVLDFIMNDKCAAGSGRFLEAISSRLGADSATVEALLALDKSAVLNSTCVVFAESEITALLAQGASREEILGGVANAMAARIAGLAARLTLTEPAALSGGLSYSNGIAKALSRALHITVRPLESGLYAGAIGSACTGL